MRSTIVHRAERNTEVSTSRRRPCQNERPPKVLRAKSRIDNTRPPRNQKNKMKHRTTAVGTLASVIAGGGCNGNACSNRDTPCLYNAEPSNCFVSRSAPSTDSRGETATIPRFRGGPSRHPGCFHLLFIRTRRTSFAPAAQGGKQAAIFFKESQRGGTGRAVPCHAFALDAEADEAGSTSFRIHETVYHSGPGYKDHLDINIARTQFLIFTLRVASKGRNGFRLHTRFLDKTSLGNSEGCSFYVQ